MTAPLANIKIKHIGLLVTNIERARKFYGECLQLRELTRPAFQVKGLWYELGPIQIHLMLHEGAVVSVHPDYETVQPHFSVELANDDFNTFLQLLNSNGVELLDDVYHEQTRTRQVFFFDPDHNMIEIITID